MKLKSFITVLLAAVLLTSFAFAEGELFTKPLKDMDTEELTAARLAIENELMTRLGFLDGLSIEPGIYIAGEDFPAGSYYFEGVEGRFAAHIYEYPSIEKTSGLGAIQEIHDVGSEVPKTGRMIFQEGNVLKIVTGPAIIHIYKGLME